MPSWTRSRARKTTCLAPPADPNQPDRRGAPRYRCRLVCSCHPISLTLRGRPWTAQVQDISADGIRLLVASPVVPGTFLSINLQTIPGQFIRHLRARVIRSTREDDCNGWIVGCILCPVLSEAELDALL